MDAPTSISLLQYCGTTWTQGNEGDCAESAMYNSLLQMTNVAGVGTKINPQFSYQTTLNAEGHPNDDAGTIVSVMFSVAEKTGLELLPQGRFFSLGSVGNQPGEDSYIDALKNTVMSTTRLTIGTDAHTLGLEISDMLNHMQSVILGFNLRDGLENQSGPFANQSGQNIGTSLGGHGVNVIGYSYDYSPIDHQYHDDLAFQSWSGTAGDHGIFKMDMESMPISDFLTVDTINGFSGTNWSGDANSLKVAELYDVILGRSPELAAFGNCSSSLSNGTSVETMAGTLLASNEGKLKLPASMTSNQFVTAMFWDIQGRSPAASGLSFWSAYLDGGGSRAHLVTEMITQTEDSTEWSSNVFTGTNQVLRNASDFLYNRALASEDLSLHMRDTGTTATEKSLLSSVLNSVTSDPNSVQAALVGVGAALGHVVYS